MVCYAEKQVKPFWSSSLGQMVQFDTIIFCRTFKNYFGQFVWIEKSHYNSRVSFHEAPIKKMDRVARRGPLARAPGALKGGHFWNCQHFCRSWRGFVAKHQKIEGGKFLFSEKNLSAGKNWKGDPLGFSNIHSVAKQQKIEGGTLWGKNFPEKKSRSAEKNWKGGPFGIFQHPFCRKTAKNWEGPFGGKIFRKKKSRSAEKIWKGGPFGLAGYGMLRGKTFWFSSLDQIVQFGAIIFYRTFVELFWSVRVDWKKKEKPP